MKCFDSSSIVGDDIVSVKFFESVSGELSREVEKKLYVVLLDKVIKIDVREEKMKEGFLEVMWKEFNRMDRKLDD